MFHATRDKVKGFLVWLMMLDDTAHSIAMGVAVGLFIGLTPTVGVQMLLVLAVSMVIRCNRTVGCAMVWVSNIATMVPIFFFNYKVGAWVLRMDAGSLASARDDIRHAFHAPGWSQRILVTIRAFGRMAIELAGPLWLGSLIVATVVSVSAYFLMRHAVMLYRRAHQRRVEASLARKIAEDPPLEERPDGKAPQDR